MGASSNPKRRADDSRPLAQFAASKAPQPGPAARGPQHRRALEQLPSLVKAWIQDGTTQTEGTLRAIFQVVAGPLLLLDRERKIMACNEAAARQIGRPAQELTGGALAEYLAAVVPAQVREQWMAQIAEAFRGAAPVRFTDESAGFVHENTIGPVLDATGEVTAVVVSIRDVTEYRRPPAELAGPDEGMQHAERRTSLAMTGATVAHELAQPLSVVQLAMQNALAELEKQTYPDILRHDLQAGLAACAKIGEIVGRFRELAQPPGKAQDTEVHILQVAARTFRLLGESARQARVTFRTENLDALPAVRMGANELDNLFFALAQNAVQAADGTRDRHLRITGALQGDMVVLRFQDDCGGIEPAHLPRIFEPFFTTKPAGQGTGLGLCIARRIVCQRGGQISGESRYGEGTIFTVTLPREPSPRAGGQYVP
jgi:PAS domain S-box-containing protein